MTSEHERTSTVSEGESRFLDRLARKYEASENAGMVRSFLIAAAVIAALFALARWLPWWWLSLVVVEAIGLLLFRQYKRFARFKTRLLRALWSEAKGRRAQREM